MYDPLLINLIESLESQLDQVPMSFERIAAISQSITATNTLDADALLLACRGAMLCHCHGVPSNIDFISLLKEIVAREPGNVEALVELGIALDVHKDEPAQAITYLQRALSIEPTHDGVLGLARLYSEQGSRRRALALLRGHTFCRESQAGRQLERDIMSGLWGPLEDPETCDPNP